ncbi:MAG: carboxypeptidase regulatory-like domain-containing protein, partial [Acidobacteria bacterium]|nr:carboxypeptidase regulatory-like domain-containing protein [Acidobacteriota bacterium]
MNSKFASPTRYVVLTLAILACGLLLHAPDARAQTSTASIVGTVTDKSGAIMPGVTVTAASPSLQVGSVSTVTDDKGEYRLSPLPIGTYSLTFELAGFETAKQSEIRLTVGFEAKINIAMSIGTVSETVNVSAVAPVVDASSTAATTQLTREALETLPGSRNSLISVMAFAPGVRTTQEVGGSALNQQATFRAFGQSGEPWNLIEGVFTNAPQTPGAGGSGASGGAGNYFDFNAFDESAISTLGNGAKTPTRGIQIVSVLRSGGNDFHGGVNYGQHMTEWQGDNLTQELIDQGVTSGNPWKTRYDLNGDIGGRAFTKQLWFYAALRKQQDLKEVAGAYQPDGDPMVENQEASYLSTKLSYQMTPSNRFVGFYQRTHKWETTGANQFTAWERRQVQRTVPETWKVQWQGTLRPSLVADLQFGNWTYVVNRFDVTHGIYPDSTLPGVSARDAVTTNLWGENPNVNSFVIPDRYHTRGTVSWYRPDWFYGNHQLDTGFDYLHTSTSRGDNLRNQPPYELVYQSGVPYQFRTQNTPAQPLQITTYLGMYLQDIWTIKKRLTLNLGARYARDNGSVPDKCREAAMFATAQCWDASQLHVWNTFAPRLHAAYDLTGDSKTVLKFGWGRFIHMRHNEPEVQDLDPLASVTTVWRWHDLNNDKAYQPGEVDLNPNGPDYVSGISGATTAANLADKAPVTDEFSASIERQFPKGLAARMTGIYSHNRKTLRLTNLARPPSTYSIPVTKPDPGPDGVVGNSDDTGTNLTYWEYSTSLAGAAYEKYTRINDSRADASYASFEFAVVKRLSNGWQFNGSVST